MANYKTLKTVTIINFSIGLILRIVVIGWLLIIFGIIEFAIRMLFLIVNINGKSWLDWNNSRHRILWISSQVSYLLASLAAVDFGDVGSYAFLQLWQNPPDELLMIFCALGLVNLAITIVMFVVGSKIKKRLRAGHLSS